MKRKHFQPSSDSNFCSEGRNNGDGLAGPWTHSSLIRCLDLSKCDLQDPMTLRALTRQMREDRRWRVKVEVAMRQVASPLTTEDYSRTWWYGIIMLSNKRRTSTRKRTPSNGKEVELNFLRESCRRKNKCIRLCDESEFCFCFQMSHFITGIQVYSVELNTSYYGSHLLA